MRKQVDKAIAKAQSNNKEFNIEPHLTNLEVPEFNY